MTDHKKANFGLAQLRALSQDQRDRLRLIYGHMQYGIHDAFSHSVGYLTLLRDPVARSISDYYFVKKEPPSHYLHEQANSLSLEAYLAYRASIARDNVQTRLLSGLWDTVPFKPENANMLERAKYNLRQHFVMVGLTEKFDESLLLLKRILGLRNVYYKPKNVAPSRPRTDSLPEETLEAVRYYNQSDLALLRYGQELFAEQRKSYGPSFETDLEHFKQWNRILGGALHRYWQIGIMLRRVARNLSR